jgi:hypothetical protein
VSNILKGYCIIHDFIDSGKISCKNECYECIWFEKEKEAESHDE